MEKQCLKSKNMILTSASGSIGWKEIASSFKTDAEVCERCFGGNLDNMIHSAANSPWSEIEVVEAPDGTFDLEQTTGETDESQPLATSTEEPANVRRKTM